MKQINDLSREELGQLFPIIILEPNPAWPFLFRSEKIEIEKCLGLQNIISLEHIGSTAVPGLKAKPSIDILLEIPDEADKHILIFKLKELAYEFIPQPENPPPNMMFAKGYTMQGMKGQAYHIHVRYKGDWDEIYFRDYLIKNAEVAKEYAILKENLAILHKNDREAYTDAKTEFVKRVSAKAR